MSGRNPVTATAVIGAGAWGTALAIHLARLGHDVRLWVYEPELLDRIRTRRDNPLYLPGVAIPGTVAATGSFGEALEGAELLIGVVPSPFARATYEAMRGDLEPAVPLVVATKGIEERSLALPLGVAADVLGSARPLAVLSGPTFAAEVAAGRATAIVVASEEAELSANVQRAVASSTLRVYTNSDPLGVQLAGALKNVMAIAAGLLDGLDAGHNALAALITRGLAEISRLGVVLGGAPATFSGLAGLGDLVLTCTGEQSRNRSLGARLGRGERLQDVLAGSRSVAEGVRTAASARRLAADAGVEMPIVEAVHRVLYEDVAPDEALAVLMRRPPTAEDAPAGPNTAAREPRPS